MRSCDRAKRGSHLHAGGFLLERQFHVLIRRAQALRGEVSGFRPSNKLYAQSTVNEAVWRTGRPPPERAKQVNRIA